ncbi:hypothetical protein C2E23DRAFT_382502 [Lenzites betulinus]|nr:hypothetical protein C2E23DRAFT_382502 [Lenzites betulinus]
MSSSSLDASPIASFTPLLFHRHLALPCSGSNSTTPWVTLSCYENLVIMDLRALLVACVTQAVFYGHAFSLAWRYFRRSQRTDPRWFDAAIGAAWLLCTFSLGATTYNIWYYFVHIGLEKHTTIAPWTVDFFLTINSAVATLVRFLYVYRLAKLCQILSYFRWRLFSAIMLVLAVLLCIVELVSAIHISRDLYSSSHASKIRTGFLEKPLFYVMFATGFAADAILTGTMCLWLHNARTGLHRTDSVINNMILYAVETGLLPSLVETSGMIAFVVAPQTQIFLAFFAQVGVLYLNSLLTSLGTRGLVHQRIRQPLSLNCSILDGSTLQLPATRTMPCESVLEYENAGAALFELDAQIFHQAAARKMSDVERPKSEAGLFAAGLEGRGVVVSLRPRAVTLSNGELWKPLCRQERKVYSVSCDSTR